MTRSQKFVFTAVRSDSGIRLDLWLNGRMPGISRSRIKQLILSGNVTSDGGNMSPHRKVKEGDVVSVTIPPAEQTGLAGQPISLDILFEDGDILVLNKQAGLVVHPAPGHPDGTLVNALLHHCSDLKGVGGELRPGIVHRLDRDTSGVMVVAKNDSAMNDLCAQFKSGSVLKHYLTIVRGVPDKAKGEIDTLIGRSRSDRKKMSANPASGGRRAVSCYEVVERLGNFSLLKVRIKTGRTHQVRVHMAHIGHNVIGDPQYGGRSGKGDGNIRAGRQMLHSHTISFMHPRTRETVEFTAPLPPDMKTLLEVLRRE